MNRPRQRVGLGATLLVIVGAGAAACEKTENLGTFKVTFEAPQPDAGSGDAPAADASVPPPPDPTSFAAVRGFFSTHCARCHSATPGPGIKEKTARKAHAALDVDAYPFGGKLGKKAGAATKAITKVLTRDKKGRRDMPLDDLTLPTDAEVAHVTAWIAAGAKP